MKYFLLLAATLGWGLTVQAQESLFPELQGKNPQAQPAQEQPVVAPLNQPVGENQPTSQEDRNVSASGNLVISISDVTIVVPPVQKMQFCSGTLTLDNQSKDDVEQLNIMVDYTDINLPYTFSGVAAGQSKRGNFAMAGEGCQYLTKLAPVNVTACRVGDWTVEECQARVKYQFAVQ